jgi:membrane-bound lytic murein transglycosylase D
MSSPARLPWVVRFAVALAAGAAVAAAPGAYAQSLRTGAQPKQNKPIFPDEFSDLDDATQGATVATWDEGVVEQLEFARKRYVKAITAIEGKDTTMAAREFERAIDILNDLASFPRIEENADFTDLAQSIIEDYETYIRNINDLDENSSVFILRNRIFEEVDRSSKRVLAEPDVAFATTLVPMPEYIPSTQIPLFLNESVEKNIEFLTGERGRKFFKKWLERSGRWMDMIKRITREENMPEEIGHLAMMESGMNPYAVSRAKAVGLWQFMQATAGDFNMGVSFWLDERRDPEKSTRAAMRYLRMLHNEFGDWHLALAAYNCGQGNVRRAIRKSGLSSPNYWQVRDLLPRETRNYVPLYIATTLVTINRTQYGFVDDSLQLHPPYEYDVVTIAEPTNLAALATCLELTADSLKLLNPEIVRHCTPPSSQLYKLKIPKGASQDFTRRFATLSDEERRPWTNHTVSRGETLASIAQRYGVPASDVATINGLQGFRTKLQRGRTLRIPIVARNEAALAVSTSTPAVGTNGTSTPASQPAAPPQSQPESALATTSAPAPSAVKAASSTVNHVVVPGDNLSAIARRYGVRLADLRIWNDIPYDRDAITIGDTLIVAVTDVARPQQTAERIRVTRTIQHNVTRGESVVSIANLYGTTAERVLQLNNMRSNASLRAGTAISVETSLAKNEIAAIQRATPSGKATIHKVKRGESLSAIAATYGVQEADVARWNSDVISGSSVFAGTKLKIYTESPQKGSAQPASGKRPPKSYRVRSGDTLTEIADKFGLTVESIRSKNRSLRSTNVLKAGQTIRLQ